MLQKVDHIVSSRRGCVVALRCMYDHVDSEYTVYTSNSVNSLIANELSLILKHPANFGPSVEAES